MSEYQVDQDIQALRARVEKLEGKHKGEKHHMKEDKRHQAHVKEEASDWITGPYDPRDEEDDYLVQPGEFARFPVEDGHIAVVEQKRGNIGFATVGRKARAILNELISVYRFSALEIYEVIGGNRKNAPGLFFNAHYAHYNGLPAAMEPRQLPNMEDLSGVTDPQLSVLGKTDMGGIGGFLCTDHGVQGPQDYFQFEFYINSQTWSNVGPLGYLGANGIYGDGQWSDGCANLWLGPTTSGAAVVCFPDPYRFGDALIRIEEKIAPGLWVQLWTGPSSYSGLALGIYFTGLVVRNIRVLIREENEAGQAFCPEPTNLHPFFWGGSY